MENEKFGRLTVVCKTNKFKGIKYKRIVWSCNCDCGATNVECTTSDLRRKNGGVKSCGCLLRDAICKHGRGLIDISGNRYGSLMVECNSGKRKHNRILWQCKYDCGNVRLIYKSDLTQGRMVSCGCHKNKLASQRRGDKHPSWKGGMTLLSQKDRCTYEYIKWRKSIYYRDNYTCQVCRKRGSELNAHHLEAFHANESLRLILDNGVTLCKICHDEFHEIYGKLFNTKSQFDEFAHNRSEPSEKT